MSPERSRPPGSGDRPKNESRIKLGHEKIRFSPEVEQRILEKNEAKWSKWRDKFSFADGNQVELVKKRIEEDKAYYLSNSVERARKQLERLRSSMRQVQEELRQNPGSTALKVQMATLAMQIEYIKQLRQELK